jgi:DNA-binding response OmpR family regulator
MARERRLIIVVDDDRPLADMICEILADERYQAIPCYNSQAAFETIQHEQPDLVITDLWMEDARSGLLLLQQMRRVTSVHDIPVIMAAANMVFLRENEQELRALNCVPLAKPFDLDDLLTKVRELIGPPS